MWKKSRRNSKERKMKELNELKNKLKENDKEKRKLERKKGRLEEEFKELKATKVKWENFAINLQKRC